MAKNGQMKAFTMRELVCDYREAVWQRVGIRLTKRIDR